MTGPMSVTQCRPSVAGKNLIKMAIIFEIRLFQMSSQISDQSLLLRWYQADICNYRNTYMEVIWKYITCLNFKFHVRSQHFMDQM